jgi:hypothetical protein
VRGRAGWSGRGEQRNNEETSTCRFGNQPVTLLWLGLRHYSEQKCVRAGILSSLCVSQCMCVCVCECARALAGVYHARACKRGTPLGCRHTSDTTVSCLPPPPPQPQAPRKQYTLRTDQTRPDRAERRRTHTGRTVRFQSYTGLYPPGTAQAGRGSLEQAETAWQRTRRRLCVWW